MAKRAEETSANVGGIAADHLRQYIERIERIEEEIKALKDDQKNVYAEAKGNGFDTKTMRQIIKLRKMNDAEREEQEALLDIYKAALGMLNGTPLGDAAVRRLTGAPEKAKPSGGDDGQMDIEDFTARAGDEVEPGPATEQEPTVEDACVMGREAAVAGKPVTDNPFPARDPRRAAWDEGWCAAAGGTGMEIPGAWQRKKKGADAAKKGGEENGSDGE